MKFRRYMLFGLTLGLSAFAVSSCAYDSYSSSSYGGYGDGYGYGSSSFSTSFFVSTGNPRWGYDPYAGCYFDHSRRAYYDPFLNGYYPVGYRPRYVSGAPHPHGWRRGKGYLPPPNGVRSYNLTNYRDRASRYRGLGRDWSRNVVTEGGRDGRGQFENRDGRRGGFQGGGGGFRDDGRGGRFDGDGVRGRGDGREGFRGRGEDGGARGRGDGRGGFQGRGDGGRGGFGGAENTSVAAPPEPQRQEVAPTRGFRSNRDVLADVRSQLEGSRGGDGGGGRRGFEGNRGGGGGEGGGGGFGGGERAGGGGAGGGEIRGIGEGQP